MTASKRGLAILTAIALALGLVVALERPRAATPTQRRLFPDFDPAAVTELTLDGPSGSVHLIRRGDHWFVDGPVPAPAAADVVADILGAFELATAERWVASSEAQHHPGGIFAIATTPSGELALAIGDEAGANLFWAKPSGTDRAALVEAWVARALDRRLADLRDPAVVHNPAPTGIELHAGGVDLVASGAPLRANVTAGVFRIAPALATTLVDALLALRFTSFTDANSQPLGTLRVLGATPDEIDDLRPCPGVPNAHLLGGSSGIGCVDESAWSAVLDAARSIAAGPDTAIDLAPLAAAPVARIDLSDGSTLTARGGDWTLTTPDGDREPDVPSVRAFLAALAEPGGVGLAATPTDHPLVITYADGTTDTLDLHGASLTRRGEPRGIVISRELLGTLVLGHRAFLDRTLLADERTRVRRIGVGDMSGGSYILRMGQTFEDWTVQGLSTVDTDALDALLDLVESLVADQLLPEQPREPRARILSIELAPPPTTGATGTTHSLEILRPRADGRCHVRVDRIDALVNADDCATLLAPLAH